VHHVSVNVRDLEAMADWYVDTLGLTLNQVRPIPGVDSVWLDAGGQQVHLITGEVPPGLGQHLALRVEDLAGAVDELRAGGLQVSDPSPVGTGLQSFLTDPDGNLIELHQPVR
jgi:catechol 2,3-dioxygenase-like lactoylglutathione lyase family enzyme